MAHLMIKCPNTGLEISTGIVADKLRFAATPVFFSRTFCPWCRMNHDWFAKEAWVSDYDTISPAHKNRSPGRMSIW